MRPVLRVLFWASVPGLALLDIALGWSWAGNLFLFLAAFNALMGAFGVLFVGTDTTLLDLSRDRTAKVGEALMYLISLGLAVGAGWWATAGLVLVGWLFWTLAREVQRSPVQTPPRS